MNPIDDFKQACINFRDIIKHANPKRISEEEKEVLKQKITDILESTIIDRKIDDRFAIKNSDQFSKREIQILHFKTLADTITRDDRHLNAVLKNLIIINGDFKKEVRSVRFDLPESDEERPSAAAASPKKLDLEEKSPSAATASSMVFMNPINLFKQACINFRDIIKHANPKTISKKDKEILKQRIADILGSTLMDQKIDDRFAIKNPDQLSKREIQILYFKSLADTITRDNRPLNAVLNRLININRDFKKEVRSVRFDLPESDEERASGAAANPKKLNSEEKSPSATFASSKEMSLIEKKDQLISLIYEDFEKKFNKGLVDAEHVFSEQKNIIRFYKDNFELAMLQILEPNPPIAYSKEEAYAIFVSLFHSFNHSINKMDEIDVDDFKILAGRLIEGRNPSAYSEKDSNILELVKNYKEGKLKSGEKVKIYYTVIKEKDLDQSLPIVKTIIGSEEFIALFNQLFE
jgi:hypothetical protein